jgi:hypothetical protein
MRQEPGKAGAKRQSEHERASILQKIGVELDSIYYDRELPDTRGGRSRPMDNKSQAVTARELPSDNAIRGPLPQVPEARASIYDMQELQVKLRLG